MLGEVNSTKWSFTLLPTLHVKSAFGGSSAKGSRSSQSARARMGAGQRPRFGGDDGTPGGTRTPDPQVRSLMLYPAELPARAKPQGTQMRAACRGRGRAAEAVSVGLGCSAS